MNRNNNNSGGSSVGGISFGSLLTLGIGCGYTRTVRRVVRDRCFY